MPAALTPPVHCAGVSTPRGCPLPGEHIGCAHDFRCTCDPTDLFDPPDPTPRAVQGCPAHRARRIAQERT